MTDQRQQSGREAGLERPVSGLRPGQRVSAVDVAVNLLWCVPGDVGGSEEYLVRQLLGLASQQSEFLPTLYVVQSFARAHPNLADLYPMVVAGITGHERPRRVLAEHVWLSRRTRRAGIVHHGGGTTPAVGSRAHRAHHPRPPVPHPPRISLAQQAAISPRGRSRVLSIEPQSSRHRLNGCGRR